MDIHKNARSCPASRELLVRRIREEGWRVSDAAASVARTPGDTGCDPALKSRRVQTGRNGAMRASA